jgi:Disintegrin
MSGGSGGQTNTSCLVEPDPNRPTISLQMCGNGIVENGEDCDPGSGAQSACCDPATCKFRNAAVCDPLSSPCCTSQCKFAPTTQVCRPSKDNLCDIAEMCTGNSSSCPADVVVPNGGRDYSSFTLGLLNFLQGKAVVRTPLPVRAVFVHLLLVCTPLRIARSIPHVALQSNAKTSEARSIFTMHVPTRTI